MTRKTKILLFFFMISILLIFLSDEGHLPPSLIIYVSIVSSAILGAFIYDYYYYFKVDDYKKGPKIHYVFTAQGSHSPNWGYDLGLRLMGIERLTETHPVYIQHKLSEELINTFADIHILHKHDHNDTHEVVGLALAHSDNSAYALVHRYCESYNIPQIE